MREGFGVQFQVKLRHDLIFSLTRDVLYELACVGELPLPQPNPPSMKREREWDTPSSSNATELTSSPQNDQPPRVFAGSRRVREASCFINQTQQLQTPLPQHQQSQATPPPSVMAQYLPQPPSQKAPSGSRSHNQLRQNESQETTSTISPFNITDLEVFALPVYTNDLRRFPLPGQMIPAQAPLSQPQPQQLNPETDYCYAASQPTSRADASGMSSSYGSHYPPASAYQQEPYLHRRHAPQGIPVRRFPPASEASFVAQDPYEMDAAELAHGMLFDAMEGRAGYTPQRTPTYGLEPLPSSFPGMGSDSMVSTPPQSSNSGPPTENESRRLGIEAMPDRPDGRYQHQRQTVPRQQEQQSSSYPFGLDDDAVTVWSNAPTGFECVNFVLVSGRNLVHSYFSFFNK